MRRVRLGTDHEIVLDGDLLALLETLYREVTLKLSFRVSFEEMMKELQALVEQMTADELKQYLVESLFLNSVTYENEMLDAYMRQLTAGKKKGRSPQPGRA